MLKKIRKIFLISALLIIVLVALFIAFILFKIPTIEIIEDNYILGAHRGDSVEFVENTIEAFESAIAKEKYKFIEFDIQYTKDKVLVVYHDKSLTRLQDKNEKITELSYKEILEVSDYHIPTYQEVMNLIAGVKPLNIEIKSQGNPQDDEEIADFLIKDLEKRDILKSTIISSISNEVLLYINEKYDTGYINWLENEELCLIENSPICNWKENVEIDTGLISYITKDTFSQVIGWKEPAIFEEANNGVNYFMLYGANLRAYNSLKEYTPENINLCFWFFTDEMYLMMPEAKKISSNFLSNFFGISSNLKTNLEEMIKPKKKICLWWCDAEEEISE
ncbi:MAG: hypothetical protein KAJ58_01295 [Candidatus Pacebacteria bacterium]|nr:hypothetical protein [Candidatus Paceibacterota bacterium]